MSTARVSKRLAKMGHPVELVRGKGYHYFIFDDGKNYESESIMVPHFRSMPFERWVEMGVEYAEKTKQKIAERVVRII